MAKRETQFLGQNETIVYEAIATVRRTMTINDLAETTGLDEETVTAALRRLTELEMIDKTDNGFGLGPNDWDVSGPR